MKTIKINLFDIDQAVDIIDDSIIKINDNKTDKFINLFEVSSIESFQYNHRYNTETYILLMMSFLSLPIMFQIKHYGATGSMLFIIFFNFIALGFALYHYNALEQRIEFLQKDKTTNEKKITFSSSYYCYNLLPKQIIMEKLNIK